MEPTTKSVPRETQLTPSTTGSRQLRLLEIGFLSLAILLGFCHVWADHHYLRNADAMSYLDIAEAYLRGDWNGAVNAYWGPLYTWLIAATLSITNPSTYWKFAVLHLLNLAIYVFSFGCFSFLIREVLNSLRSQRKELDAAAWVAPPDWALLTLGYSLFIWAGLFLVTVPLESPDMLVASCVYVATGILLRIRRKPTSWLLFPLLGITLGFGYLAKAVMLPLAAVFIIATLLAVGNLRRSVPRLAITVVFFLLVVGPFVFALSQSKGRLTVGGTGRLNYLWSINKVPNNHWQGEQPGSGEPKHPTRKLLENPPTFEFGEPIGGTYPVWYDPTYWYEGSVSHFNLMGQIRVFVNCIKAYYDIFLSWGIQYGLLVGLLTLYLMSGRERQVISDLVRQWGLFIAAIAGLGLYALVHVERRFIASFIVLLWMGLFSAVRMPSTPNSERLLRAIVLVLVVSVIFTTIGSSMGETSRTVSQLVRGEDPVAHEQWQVAEGLRDLGLVSSDKVASIGDSFRAFWAHLLGVRIVAEVRRDKIEDFWKANATSKREVLDAFARSGAKAVVADNPPIGTDLTGWQKIRETHFYLYVLAR